MRAFIAAMLSGLAVVAMPAAADEKPLPWAIDCQEIVHAQANDALTSYTVEKDKVFNITFSRLDDENWIMTGNAGSVPVVAMDGPGVIHFLESTPFGTINITQIMLSGNPTVLKGVHSRHPVLAGEIFPSQWLLACKVR